MRQNRLDFTVVAFVLLALFSSDCGKIDAGPTAPTPVEKPTPIPTPSPEPIPAPVPAPSPAPSPTLEIPWPQLPPISDAAKQILLEGNINTTFGVGGEIGAVKGWRDEDFPIPFYVGPDFPEGFDQKVAAFWATETNGDVTLAVVGAVPVLGIVEEHVWPPPYPIPPNICAASGPRRIVANNFLFASGQFSLGECGGTPLLETMTHEVCHMLGIAIHPNTGDICDIPRGTPRLHLSPVMKEVFHWKRLVKSGTRPA